MTFGHTDRENGMKKAGSQQSSQGRQKLVCHVLETRGKVHVEEHPKSRTRVQPMNMSEAAHQEEVRRAGDTVREGSIEWEI